MKYNRPQATASYGSMAKDWEKGSITGLHKQRLARAQEAGAVLCLRYADWDGEDYRGLAALAA